MKSFCRILLSTLMVIIFMVKMSKADCRICRASKLPRNICQNAAGQNCTCTINSFDRSCMRQSGSYYVCSGPTGCVEGGNFDIKGRGCTREKKLFKLTIL